MNHNSCLLNLRRNTLSEGERSTQGEPNLKVTSPYMHLLTISPPCHLKYVALRLHGNALYQHTILSFFSIQEIEIILCPTAAIDKALLLTGFMRRSEKIDILGLPLFNR